MDVARRCWTEEGFIRSSLWWISGISPLKCLGGFQSKFPPALEIWKLMKYNHPRKVKGCSLLGYLLKKWWCLSASSLAAHTWSTPQASPPDKSSLWGPAFLIPANTASSRLWLACICTLLASVCLRLWQCKLWHKWLFQPFLSRLSSPWRRTQFVSVALTPFGAIRTGLRKHFISYLSWR